MESAHLTKAHEHVRTAATATYGNSIATAGHEHDLAAAAFHDAAQDTRNDEALRILDLLQDHHRKLAGLIKEAPRKKDAKTTAAGQASDASTTALPPRSTTARSVSSPSSPPAPRRRLPQSSIATNLAEKRGIPSVRRTASGTPPTLSDAAALRHDQPTPVRDLLDRHAKPAPSPSKPSPRQQKDTSPAEANFRRFYSAFGGVISAISAPLAFTSLPLNIAPPTPVPEPPKDERPSKTRSRNPSPEASRTVKSSVPDLAALISKPALRALRDGSSQINPFASNESFYLVPTSGATVTYASILQNPQGPHLHAIDEASDSLKGSSHSHDEFVDARESINPPSPTTTRRPHSRSGPGVTAQRNIPAGRGAGLKTLEELALENETLKTLVDKQAKRIQMWETNSQNQFNALAQSFRTKAVPHPLGMGTPGMALPSPPIPGQHYQHQSSPSTDEDSSKKLADLEAALAAQTAKLHDVMTTNDQLAKQNEKNAQVIGRYREQWEKLKAGARKKEHERRERRVADLKGGETAKDSESGDATGEAEGDVDDDDEAFGKA
ncbi:hypothetical protein P153DRAFT_88912 [Dothidotthia symphoricarpi CBS 119687]|uniref:Uncharacterized protein n=1 Tax=Dothidotthia symphoricarpi CBS 119687 TaxID=1392245 RepID=A0A6A6A509_9PLEO|nr:uncharacterized protein P153DRAFT_88912 [Dothidotthia symphoricarpi CBS 119687]KAF2126253.1 hypothetical protein P153DRAFT_88912 [Dothidotthia symphoricarpi CBS 119687]